MSDCNDLGLQAYRVLILPGWQNSDAEHWQSHWESAYGYLRVEQHDWQRPRKGDWQARLDEVVSQQDLPVVLVAHSLGCQLVSRWAANSRFADRVVAALLVAPPDTETLQIQHQIPGWSPILHDRLPFRSLIVASADDPFCSIDRAAWMASMWASDFVNLGAAGHINSSSGLGAWPQGHALLTELVKVNKE